MNRRAIAISFIMSYIIFTGIGSFSLFKGVKLESPQFSTELNNLYGSGGEKTPVIVFFNSSSYSLDAETRFLEYGGVINNERKWK